MLKIDHLVKNYNTFSRDRLQGLWGKTEQAKVQFSMQYWD